MKTVRIDYGYRAVYRLFYDIEKTNKKRSYLNLLQVHCRRGTCIVTKASGIFP